MPVPRPRGHSHRKTQAALPTARNLACYCVRFHVFLYCPRAAALLSGALGVLMAAGFRMEGEFLLIARMSTITPRGRAQNP